MDCSVESLDALRHAWRKLRAERVRARDAAARIGVSEAALVAAMCGEGTTRLTGDARAILAKVPALGPVMALTRNDACVHEKCGVYQGLEIDADIGIALGPDIDLRLFFAQWRHAFAIADGTQCSLQFFDGAGDAVHKIHLRPGSDYPAYADLVFDHTDADQSPRLSLVENAPRPAEKPDDAIDVEGFRDAWEALQDTHHFFGLLRRFGVTRAQAMRLGGSRHAIAVPNASAEALLRAAAREAVPIMVFVGNRGCIQIHTGPITTLTPSGMWLNVMDPGFNLHLRTDAIAESWIVRKPTVDGVVTSLELFDASGDTIAQFFGARKPGLPERMDWRELLERAVPTATI